MPTTNREIIARTNLRNALERAAIAAWDTYHAVAAITFAAKEADRITLELARSAQKELDEFMEKHRGKKE